MRKSIKMLTAALLALPLLLPVTAAAADDTPPVRISEMMYKNHATLQDADGDFSDWFELENTSNRTVQLACDPELPADHVLRREKNGEIAESVWATPGYPNTAAGYAAFCESRVTESPLVIYEAAVYNDAFALKGEYYDWVEIKNVSKESEKLSDCCLSDDRKALDKWTLPNRTLGKGQSILIYCTGEEDPTGTGVRAPFALNASSETLYLTKRGESAAADYVWLHDIPYGRSMGRVDGENGFSIYGSRRRTSRTRPRLTAISPKRPRPTVPAGCTKRGRRCA